MKELDTAKTATDAIVSFRETEDGFECANSYLKPYQASPEEFIQASAQLFAVAMTELAESVEGFRQEYKRLIDGINEKPSEHAELAAALTVKGDDAWHVEFKATECLLYSLIGFDDKKTQQLKLTAADRDAMVAKLKATFGDVPHAKGALFGVEGSVTMLLNFLTDKDRRTADGT
jgi:hypothetical protein